VDTNAPSPLIAAVDTHLLATVGVAPAQATATELMQAVAQVAREQLSRR
jgi:starch phosphorylase